MITLFTTTKPFKDIAYNQQVNAIQSWFLIDEQVEIFVFGDNIPHELVEKFHIRQVQNVASQFDNLPLCNAMFEYVAENASHPVIIYLNSDIILPTNFGEEVLKIHNLLKSNYLIIGQRIDYDLDQLVIQDKSSLRELYKSAIKSGTLHPPYGSDYFVMPRDFFEKGEMPKLTVGRPGWDLWPIYQALEVKKAHVIDLSKKLLVIHQNHPQAYKSVHTPDDATIQNLSFLPEDKTYYYTLDKSNYEWTRNKLRFKKPKLTLNEQLLVLKRKIRRQLSLIKRGKIKVSIGAGITKEEGWMFTDIHILDLTKMDDFKDFFLLSKASNMMAEHVWEHLNERDTELANKNCYKFLRRGGRLRIAVPDGFHPDPEYIEHVRPGGIGIGADDHKILYNYKTLAQCLENAGFQVDLLEYWDEQGEFHFKEWDKEDGFIRRSARYDPRNTDNQLNYTSLIIDGIKK